MRAARTAFTLIEILVSVAIGTAIVAAAWAAFMQVRQATIRSKAMTVLHQDAATIGMNFENAFSSCFHGSLIRLEVSNPGDPVNATLTLDVMRSSEQLTPGGVRTRAGSQFSYDLMWERFRIYARDASGKRSIHRASSAGPWAIDGRVALARLNTIQMQADPYAAGHNVPVWTAENVVVNASVNVNTPRVMVGPEVRRDRRRSMLDNDLRLWPNIPRPLWLGFTTTAAGARVTTTPPSDEEQLDRLLSMITDKLTAFRIELVDFQGLRTTCDPFAAGGIVYLDRAGTAIPPPAAPPAPEPHVWSTSLRVFDGLWTDGRSTPCPAYAGAKAPADERPALVRIAFTLTDPQSVRADPEHPIAREFSFTIATSPLTVTP